MARLKRIIGIGLGKISYECAIVSLAEEKRNPFTWALPGEAGRGRDGAERWAIEYDVEAGQ